MPVFLGLALLMVGGCTMRVGADGSGREPRASFEKHAAAANPSPHADAFAVDATSSGPSLRTFLFEYDDVSIQADDVAKIREISAYIRDDPALRVVIDGSVSPRGLDSHNSGLRDRRVAIVREALIAAGVPAYLIEVGKFGRDPQIPDRSVKVLVRAGE